MRKIVNGVSVDLTPEERAEQLAAIAAWEARHIPTEDELDTEELNRMLMQPGTVLRGLAEVVFGIAKGTIPVTPSLTVQQFRTLIKQRMR